VDRNGIPYRQCDIDDDEIKEMHEELDEYFKIVNDRSAVIKDGEEEEQADDLDISGEDEKIDISGKPELKVPPNIDK